MMNHAFPGGALRERREELGLSPDDVFKRIRIPTAYLDALERGRLEELPPPCYVTGFLRSYCGLLGLDPDYFVSMYRTMAEPAPRRYRLTEAVDLTRRPSWLGEVFAWTTVLAILLLFWTTYNIIVRPQSTFRDAERVRVDAGAAALAPPSGEPGETDEEAPHP